MTSCLQTDQIKVIPTRDYFSLSHLLRCEQTSMYLIQILCFICAQQQWIRLLEKQMMVLSLLKYLYTIRSFTLHKLIIYNQMTQLFYSLKCLSLEKDKLLHTGYYSVHHLQKSNLTVYNFLLMKCNLIFNQSHKYQETII